MILEELQLHNYCLYKGAHLFALGPTTRDGMKCPITLFGGMNGAGKTTILDAVQLALYGSRARTASRLGKPYEEYLRECIHRGASPDEGTSVSIKFRYHAEGHQRSYEVSRSWSLKDKFVRERVRVTKDDVEDAFLSEQWSDVVEDLIPIGVSQLFFFDAEKIRFLADDETDTAALGAAIKSLLGLDLAERLIADAAVIEKRLQDTVLDRSNDERIEKLQRELELKSVELTTAKADRASLENPLLRARTALEKAKKEFSSVGGEHWNRRSEIQGQLEATEAAIQEMENELRDFSAGELPLLLVPDLLLATMHRDIAELKASNARAFHELLTERDAKIVKKSRAAGLAAEALQILRKLFEQDRKSRLDDTDHEQILELSGQARVHLGHLATVGIEELHRKIKKVIAKLKTLQATREKCLRLLSATPDDSAAASHLEQIQECATAFGKLEGESRRLDAQIETFRHARDEIDRKVASVRKELVDRQMGKEESLRMAKLAQRTQITIREFLKRATAHKIERLSDLVTSSFLFLISKQTLVARVQIHPENFRIDMFDDAGKPVSKSRLSEGEKQIFAVAVLWGLAQASPRQLPAIIDTPMARLDSEHRQHLVERYFPNASHQVIILSTDTEIERRYFEQLRPRVARSYHLRYDESSRSSVASEGYFWDVDKVADSAEAAV